MRLTALPLLLIALLPLSACENERSNELIGYVEANLVLVGPEESGRLDQLEVDEGDQVKKGAFLFMLESKVQEATLANAKARLNEAEANLVQARRNHERAAQLVKRGVTSQSRLDDMRAAFDTNQAVVAAAQAAYDEAKTKLERRKVYAPAAGSVEEVYFRPGEVVGAGQPVIALLPPDNLRVRFYVPEPMRAALQIGDQIGISCDGCPPGLSASISFIAREAEFTPPVIFSREERHKLVYLVEARPQGKARDLTAGQPISVMLPPAPVVAGP